MKIRLCVLLMSLWPVAPAKGQLYGKLPDASAFTVEAKKSAVPNTILNAIGVVERKNIADANEPYGAGCTNLDGLPKCRLNWAAFNKSGKWILSVEYGGVGSFTLIHVVTVSRGSISAEGYSGLELNASSSLPVCIDLINSGSLEAVTR